MTIGVNVDFISNCFFTCKDRALERDRPYLRKKNSPAIEKVDARQGRTSWFGPDCLVFVHSVHDLGLTEGKYMWGEMSD